MQQPSFNYGMPSQSFSQAQAQPSVSFFSPPAMNYMNVPSSSPQQFMRAPPSSYPPPLSSLSVAPVSVSGPSPSVVSTSNPSSLLFPNFTGVSNVFGSVVAQSAATNLGLQLGADLLRNITKVGNNVKRPSLFLPSLYSPFFSTRTSFILHSISPWFLLLSVFCVCTGPA